MRDDTITDSLVGQSVQIRDLKAEMRVVAHLTLPVLISGERGTGKRLIGRVIHRHGPYRARPIAAIDCAIHAPFEAQFESVDRTIGSQPNSGSPFATLVLCHVDLLNASAQDRLFEHLEHRERARVIATTTADLGEMTAMRRFRQDLFYRLNGIHLESPPLRQRREDIPLLVQHWLRFWSASRQIPCPQLSAAALKHLIGHEWPGNVGELQAMVEEICGRMDSGVIHPFHLPSTYRRKTSGTRSLSSW